MATHSHIVPGRNGTRMLKGLIIAAPISLALWIGAAGIALLVS